METLSLDLKLRITFKGDTDFGCQGADGVLRRMVCSEITPDMSMSICG